MKFVVLTIISILLFAANLFFGAIHIPAGDVAGILFGRGEVDQALRFIVLDSRLPQAITAFLLGISSGASLGVALVMLISGGAVTVGSMTIGGYAAVVGGALAGSLGIMALLIVISSAVRTNLLVLIAGIMTGYLTSSVVTLLSSVTTAEGLQGYVYWGMGSFSDVPAPQLPWFTLLTVGGIVMSLLLAKPLNILLLGDDYARNLGVRIGRVRNMLLLSTGLLTAVITAYCGPISFIGMAIPHVARFYFRTDNHWVLMPASLLLGGIMGLGCNVASTIPENSIIPINALTAVGGVPVILAVIFHRK